MRMTDCFALLRTTIPALAVAMLSNGCAYFMRPIPDPPRTHLFRLLEENDAFGGGSDARYTNGIRPAYEASSAPAWTIKTFTWPHIRWANRWASTPNCAAVATPGGHCLSAIVGAMQTMYTPTEKHRILPDTTDRPYAGVFMFTEGLRRESIRDATLIELDVGVLGPWGFSHQTQDFVHHVRSITTFDGWRNQIPNHLAANLLARRQRRFASPDTALGGFAVEAAPRIEGVLGTTFIYGATGGQMRAGWHLTPEWGGEKMSETRYTQILVDRGLPSESAQALASKAAITRRYHVEMAGTFDFDGRAVGLNATLDDTPHGVSQPWVKRRPFVGEYAYGGQLRLDLHERLTALGLSFRRVFRTREFSGPFLGANDHAHKYGVFALTASW